MNHNQNQAQLFTGATNQQESQEQQKKSPQNPNSAAFHHDDVRSKSPALNDALMNFLISCEQKQGQNLFFSNIKIGTKSYKPSDIGLLKAAIKGATPKELVTICFEGEDATTNRDKFLNEFAKQQTGTVIFENITNLNKDPHEDGDVCFHCINNNKNFDITYAQVQDIFENKEQLNKLLDAIEQRKETFNTKALDIFIKDHIKNLKPSAAAPPQISQQQ